MKKVSLKLILVSTFVIALAVAAFFWNEARKELFFLCGNFTEGISEQSVRRQLDTGNFLSYSTERLPGGSRIIAESDYPLLRYRCVIEIDDAGMVTESRLE